MIDFTHVDWLAVAVAAAVAFPLGALWYSPVMFLPAWTRATGQTAYPQPKHPPVTFGLSFLANLVAAALLAALLGPAPGLAAAIGTGAAIGIGFVAASFAVNYLFASRPLALWLIDAGYYVVQFSLYGLVLGLWP